MFISSRYLATVRREMGQPCRSISSLSFWSDRGRLLSSWSSSCFSSARAAVPHTAAPDWSAVALREKK